MQAYQRDFLRFAADIGALRFGEFTLKSGRRSPYFFNAGLFDTGLRLERLAAAYAGRIGASGVSFDVLYGPAYKGIPLAAATSIAVARETGRDLPYAFNRKEAKDHGEGGLIVGRSLAGRVLIIDDVITAGTSVRESMEVIQSAGAQAVGVVIALDRQERGANQRSAVDEVRELFGVPVFSVVTLDDLIGFLDEAGMDDTVRSAVRALPRSLRGLAVGNSYILPIAALLMLGVLSSAVGAGGADGPKMFRWVDENGVVHYTDQIPPNEIDKGHAELSKQGVRVDQVPPIQTLEEIQRERELERLRAQQDRLVEQQKAADRVLLRTFRSVDDLLMARDGKLAAIDVVIQVARGNIRRQQDWLRNLRADAANLERAGKPVPQHMTESIGKTERFIRDFLRDHRRSRAAEGGGQTGFRA